MSDPASVADHRRLGAAPRCHRVERERAPHRAHRPAADRRGRGARPAAGPGSWRGRRFALVLVSPLRRARADLRAGRATATRPRSTTTCASGTTATTRASPPPRSARPPPGWTVWTAPVPRRRDPRRRWPRRADRVDRTGPGAPTATSPCSRHGHILRVLTARWCELDPIEGRRFPLDTATRQHPRAGSTTTRRSCAGTTPSTATAPIRRRGSSPGAHR